MSPEETVFFLQDFMLATISATVVEDICGPKFVTQFSVVVGGSDYSNSNNRKKFFFKQPIFLIIT